MKKPKKKAEEEKELPKGYYECWICGKPAKGGAICSDECHKIFTTAD